MGWNVKRPSLKIFNKKSVSKSKKLKGLFFTVYTDIHIIYKTVHVVRILLTYAYSGRLLYRHNIHIYKVFNHTYNFVLRNLQSQYWNIC